MTRDVCICHTVAIMVINGLTLLCINKQNDLGMECFGKHVKCLFVKVAVGPLSYQMTLPYVDDVTKIPHHILHHILILAP